MFDAATGIGAAARSMPFGGTKTISERLSAAVVRSAGLEPQSFAAGDAVDISKVEKHLDDINKGRGHLSSATGKELVSLNYQNSSKLGRLDPGTSQLYAGIVSGLNYQLNARLVNNVSQTADTFQRLKDLASIDQEQVTDNLVRELTGKGVAELSAAPVETTKAQAAAAYEAA